MSDALLAIAEEYAVQIISNGGNFKQWNAVDLGISAVSGAATGAIEVYAPPDKRAIADLINALVTSLWKEKGGLLESFKTLERAAFKALTMAALTLAMKYFLNRADINPRFHDDFFISLNVVGGRAVDLVLDLIY